MRIDEALQTACNENQNINFFEKRRRRNLSVILNELKKQYGNRISGPYCFLSGLTANDLYESFIFYASPSFKKVNRDYRLFGEAFAFHSVFFNLRMTKKTAAIHRKTNVP